MGTDAATTIADLYQTDWGRIVATLIGLLGDFDLAEEVAQEAFAKAVARWPDDGVPDLPRAWIIRTARNWAVDLMRRRATDDRTQDAFTDALPPPAMPTFDWEADDIPDDRLRLICTCCHPALALDAQVALTLRTLCGLTTDEIARALLVPVPTMAQRLVRAKQKIRQARIPYVVPQVADVPERVEAILTVIYLIFNEGYVATRGAPLIRTDLCAEAIRLGRLVRELLAPTAPAESAGLLALMLCHDARREARVDADGDRA